MFKSIISPPSAFRPNHTMAQSLIKKIGRYTRKSTAKAIANPGKTCTRPTKKTYFAQNREVPGNPIVTRTPRTDNSHSKGADSAVPPI